MNKILLAFTTFFLLSNLHGQSKSDITLNITDNGIYFGTEKLVDSPTIFYFISKLGEPNRKRQEKTYVSCIYDDLGLEILFWKKNNQINGIKYCFKSFSKSDTKMIFEGNVYINNKPINKKDSPNGIKVKLPDFDMENILGHMTFGNGKIEFTVTSLPSGSGSIFDFTYYFNRENWIKK